MNIHLTCTKENFFPLGDSAVVITFGTKIHSDVQKKIQHAMIKIEQNPFRGYIECVPAYTNLTVYYHPSEIEKVDERLSVFETVVQRLESCLTTTQEGLVMQNNTVHIPVCYEKAFAPDIEAVAEYNRLTVAEVISRHTSAVYKVHMIGFAPGFPFIGGMDKSIATPRRNSPRQAIPAGSVGIAGEQTGVYPIETPGGWNLIGRTPKRLFLPKEAPPTLLKAGDAVVFYPIDAHTYDKIQKEEEIYGY